MSDELNYLPVIGALIFGSIIATIGFVAATAERRAQRDEGAGSFWNYRIIRVTYDGEVAFEIRECHYGEDQRDIEPPIPHSVSTVAASVSADSAVGVRHALVGMMRACDRPVIDFASFDRHGS